MDQNRYPIASRPLTGIPSRRDVLRGLAGAGLALSLARSPISGAAKQRKPKHQKGLCQKNGSRCKKPGSACKTKFCLNAPFTIEANWTESTADHDTVLFVPQENEATGPFPFIHHGCNPDDGCAATYPFACVSRDAQGPGDEITTVYELLPGTYEYWIELYTTTPAGELSIVLKDSGGRVVRRWQNPANPVNKQVGWHVFDIDGRLGRVTSIDELIDEALEGGAHDPNTNVCPSTT